MAGKRPRCDYCKRAFTPKSRGRPARFCCPGHRQRAYELRRAQSGIPVLLLHRDLDAYASKASIELAVLDALRKFGMLPPEPKRPPPLRIVSEIGLDQSK